MSTARTCVRWCTNCTRQYTALPPSTKCRPSCSWTGLLDALLNHVKRLSVLIFDVISREPDLRLCTVSQVMSSAACLKLMSFFEMVRRSIPAGSPVPPMARGATGGVTSRDAGRAVLSPWPISAIPLTRCSRVELPTTLRKSSAVQRDWPMCYFHPPEASMVAPVR
jgi:hypothetical protein